MALVLENLIIHEKKLTLFCFEGSQPMGSTAASATLLLDKVEWVIHEACEVVGTVWERGGGAEVGSCV
jgi:hypothetical protein